jgi:hypothetical protein
MQLTLSVSAFLALVASTVALQVTAPAEDSTIDLTQDNTIEWTSVSSDVDSFDIILTNMNVNPSVRITLASDVQTSEGSYDISAVEGAAPGGNYRINLEGTQNSNQGILAQSGPFNVAEAGSSSTSLASFSSSTPSTSGMTSTSTMTSTMASSGSMTTMTTSTSTGSASSSESAEDSASATGSSTSSADAAASTGGASSLNTFAGAGVLAMVAALLA